MVIISKTIPLLSSIGISGGRDRAIYKRGGEEFKIYPERKY